MASWDFASLCQNVMDFHDTPADDIAESDKQAAIRAIEGLMHNLVPIDCVSLRLNLLRSRALLFGRELGTLQNSGSKSAD